jgi:polysaccharide biosynthesis protein PslG
MGLRTETPTRCLLYIVTLTVLCLGIAGAALLSPPPASAACARGIVDNRLEYSNQVDLPSVPGLVDAMGPNGLNATWTRVLVRWSYLQPKEPGVAYAGDANHDGYDDHYLTELDTVMAAFQAQHIQVILTGSDVPRWAANPKYIRNGRYSNAVPLVGSPKVLKAFQQFGHFLVQHFRQYDVHHFEVWNEPNLATGIWPQTIGKKHIGPDAYLKMLKAFWTGAKQADRHSVVIGGATSRFGSPGNDDGSSSPQWFAKYLKDHGAAKWFDAYSHHPYTKRGSDPVPSVPPKEASKAVTLGNISVLLKLFPTKPFYLTEFCYSTVQAPQRDAFVVAVSRADQARYLRQAYDVAGRYRQIKVMLWFLVKDWQSDTNPDVGVFTGLVDKSDQRKPAWYAFVGGNKLSATAPASAAAGSTFTVSGKLTIRDVPAAMDVPGAGFPVLLQRRGLAGGNWSTVTTPAATTDAGGAYSFSVTQTAGSQYRVIWDGVCESAPQSVRLP